MPLNALLLTKDSDLTRSLSGILDGLEIAVEHCSEPFAAAKRLMDHHFDVVFVDCDDQQGAAWVLQSARMASRNNTALTVAIIGENSKGRAGKLNENFVLNKPLQAKQAESTLCVAKNLMVKNQAESANAGPAAPAVAAFTPAAVVAPPKPHEPAAVMHSEVADWSADALDALEALGEKPQPASSLPPAPERLRKVEEVPAPLAHASASHGSAAAAAPAREPASALPRSEPHSEQEVKPADVVPHAAAPAIEPKTAVVPPAAKAAAAKPAPARVAKVKPAVSEPRPHFAEPQPQVVQAEAPAVQPLAPDPPPVSEFRSGLLSSVDSASASERSPRVAQAVAIVVLIAGVLVFSFWRMHHRSGVAQPVVASAPQPSAPVSASVPQPAAPDNASVAAPVAPLPATSNKKSTQEQAAGKMPKAEAEPVVVEQGAIRMPGTVTKPTAQDEETVAPPSGVVEPGTAPNLGHVVAALPAAMPAPAPAQRITVSQGVSQGLLLHQVNPLYPAMARDAHVGGAVRLRAIIGKDGAVHSLTLVGGHPLLAKSAMDAVRQWKYRPYLLNGQPVEVQTEITVQFKM